MALVEVLCVAVLLAVAACAQSGEPYRICIVDRAGNDLKLKKYCTLLQEDDSKARCVIGNSRIDCLRHISEGTADFTVLNAEEIQVAANYRSRDVAVTNEMRYFRKQDYEYEVVAVVRKDSNITGFSQLKGKRFCHPGYGYETDWNHLVSKFFEARVVPQSCDANLTLSENYIKSTSDFFKAACKAGPWVPDFRLDAELKARYPNLCYLCDNPKDCSTLDKYWGRMGPLYCLTDGLGDIAWARLDDVKAHFGFTSGIPQAALPDGYNLLCIDESVLPLSKANKCSWISKPWPAVVARSQAAEGVQELITEVANTDSTVNWLWSLQYFLNSVQQTPIQLNSIAIPEDYLTRAPGYASANAMTHCDPMRAIRVCTTSNLEYSKCNWLKEAAIAYGIEPHISCVAKTSSEECMEAVQQDNADVVVIKPDLLTVAFRMYGLKPLLFEYSDIQKNLYTSAAIVRKDSKITTLGQLKGKKACFTTFDGVGWNSAVLTLLKKGELVSTCPTFHAVGQYFSSICVKGINASAGNFKPLCSTDAELDMYTGEAGAFRCLATGKGDVAFISLNTVSENTDGANIELWAKDLKSSEFQSLCVDNSSDPCYLAWASSGQIMVKSTISDMKIVEMYTMFMKMSNMFGKHYKTQTALFQLFGEFDGQHNILFHDATDRFEDYSSLQEEINYKHNYEKLLTEEPVCTASSAERRISSALMLIFIVILF